MNKATKKWIVICIWYVITFIEFTQHIGDMQGDHLFNWFDVVCYTLAFGAFPVWLGTIIKK